MMKRYIEGNINGQALFNKIFLALIISAAWSVIRQVIVIRHTSFFGIDMLHMVIMTAASLYIQFYTAVYVIEGVVMDKTHLQFSGSLSEYVQINLSGLLLTVVTLGLYTPWFLRNLYNFFAQNISYRGSNASFKGNPTELLKYIAVCIVAYILLIFVVTWGILSTTSGVFPFILLFIVLLFLAVILIHVHLIWALQLSFKDYVTRSTAPRVEGSLFLLGQILLGIITFGFYLPWAYLKIATFYAGYLHIENHEGDKAYLSFTPQQGDGLLILGQWLLTGITLGIYGPFATAKIGNRLLYRISLDIPEETKADPWDTWSS